MKKTDTHLNELDLFKFTIDNVSDFVGICDMNFIPFYLNKEGLKMVGLKSFEEVKEKTVYDFFFPEDADYLKNVFFPKVLEEGKGETEIRFRNFKTGKAIWMIYNVVRVKDSSDNPVGYATISKNITEQKIAADKLKIFSETLEEKVESRNKELKLSEEKFSKIFYSSPMGMTLSDINTGKIIEVNDVLLQMVGYSREEYVGKTSIELNLIDNESRQKLIDHLNNNGSIRNAEIEIHTKSGKVIPILNSTEIISLGGRKYYMSSIINLSERKENERKIEESRFDLNKINRDLEATGKNLQKSENRYKKMVNEIKDYAIFYLNRHGIIENWNEGAEKIKGYKADEITGKNFGIFYTEKDRIEGLPERLLNEAAEKGRITHEGWRVRKNGTMFWGSIVITALHDDNMNVTGFSKITRDLTQQMKAEEEIKQANEELRYKNATLENVVSELKLLSSNLRKSEERYHQMIKEVEDYAIISLSSDGVIENWNEGAEKIKGYKSEEIIGKNFSIFYPESDRKDMLPQKLLQEAAKNGKTNHEGWRVRKDRSKFWGNVLITAIHDEQNNVKGYSKVTRDLTDKKLAEDKLNEAHEILKKRNEELVKINHELESFAYIASHDLQEPLRKIQTFATRILQKEKENLSESGSEQFQRMQKAANRMQNLIDDLLTYSRTNTAERKFEKTDLNVIIDEVKDELKDDIKEKNGIIDASKMDEMEIIPFQFRQLMNNLVSNSLKFSKPGIPPVVKIKATIINGNDLKDENLLPNKEYYQITISDNGIGFEQKYSGKIFEVFQRLHGRDEYKGTGIGLSIVKKIVEIHHGVITVKSEPGVGTTFEIYIPVKQ